MTDNKTQYTYTKEEWLAEGKKLFGENFDRTEAVIAWMELPNPYESEVRNE